MRISIVALIKKYGRYKGKKYLKYVFFAIIALFAVSNLGEILVSPYVEKAEAAWYNSNWDYRKKITIDHTKIPNTNQTNFPMLINTTDLDWRDVANGGNVSQSDGGDILFTKSDGSSKLDYEIEKYDNTTGELVAWVKVDSLSSGADTDIYIYYGNAACADQWNVNGTWDSDYKMVQHLNETSGVHGDSTSNNNDGTPSVNGITQNAGGQISGADDLNGYVGSVSVPDSGSLDISNEITIEGWIMKNPGTPITNCMELQNMKNDLGGYYYLANDIDCSATIGWNAGAGFDPVGVWTNPFRGTFDGRGHKITDLYINRPGTDRVGLFGDIERNPGYIALAKIKNVILENVDITGNSMVGGVVGSIFYGEIANCSVTGNIEGKGGGMTRVGGIAGYMGLLNAPMSYCHFNGSVTGVALVGGLIGDSNNNAMGISIANSYSVGSVSITNDRVGGLVGDNFSGIINSYSVASVNDPGGPSWHGGLVGTNFGNITNLYWDTQISGENNMCGIEAGTGCDDTHGKTTAEMKQQATFVGWDFVNVWTINEGVGYPTLRWQEWDNSLIGKERGAYALQISEDGSELHGYINNNQISASISDSTGWHYYVLTYDGVNQKLFIDGNLENTAALAGAITSNSSEVKIGGGSAGEFDEYLFGSMDEVKISSTARSDDWIAANYNNQKYPDKAIHGAAGFYSIGSEDCPTFIITEAEDKNGTIISNNGTVNLDNTDTITINSTSSDASGISDHKIRWWHYDSGGTLLNNNTDTWATGGLHTTTIFGPLNDGDRIEYMSEATDTIPNPTTYDPAGSEACGNASCAVRYSFTVVKTKTWAKKYQRTGGFSDIDNISSIQQTSDGGYVAVGYSERGAVIVKLDSNGNQIKTKTFKEKASSVFFSVQQIPGGYIASGYMRDTLVIGSRDNDPFIVKMDENFNKIWEKTYGGDSVENEEYGLSVQQANDSGYVVVGGTCDFGIGGEFLVVKLAENGDKVWAKTFGGVGHDVAYSIQQANGGGYTISGFTNSFGAGKSDFLIVKIAENGDKIWAKTFGFGGVFWEHAYSIQRIPSGGYIVGGFTGDLMTADRDFLIVKIAENGDKVWAKTFGGNHADTCWSVQLTSDNGYIVVGNTSSFGRVFLNKDLFIVKLAENGDKVWARAFGEVDMYDSASSVQQTSDGGYIVAGQTQPIVGGDNNDFLIVKLDKNGDIEDCTPPLDVLEVINLSDVTLGLQVSNVAASIIDVVGLNLSDANSATSFPVLTEVNACGDSTFPTLTTEAWIPDMGTGTEIIDGGVIDFKDIDEVGESITIYSDASDDSGIISDQKIRWWRYDSGGALIASGNGLWDTTTSPVAGGLNSITITGPLNDGDKIEYSSEATDGAANTICDPDDLASCGIAPFSERYSFTVKSLSVDLSASPSSGDVPLNNVDLFADIEGTAGGDTIYIFDCDISVAGTDHSYTGAADYTIADICDYAVAGSYTAKVEVVREGLTASDIVTIAVIMPDFPALTTEAWYPDDAGTYIPNSTTVSLADINDAGKITIYSTSSDTGTGIQDHWLRSWINIAPQLDLHNNTDGVLTKIILAGLLADNDFIEYSSEAINNPVSSNTTFDPADGVSRYSFTIKDTTLSVDLSANPSSGTAPLDVDLTATLGGTATGDATYVLDCDITDGTTDGNYIGDVNSYTFSGLDKCSYAAAGDYIAKVEVTREELTASDIVTISVAGPNAIPTVIPSLPSIPTSWCVSSPGSISLSWLFKDDEDGDGNQTAYRIDLSRDGGAATCTSGKKGSLAIPDNKSNLSGAEINLFATDPGGDPGCANFIDYGNHTYDWDITVWDSDNAIATATPLTIPPATPTISFGPTPAHQYPTAKFSYLPAPPLVQFQNINFDPLTAPDDSVCYDNSGNIIDCSTFEWDFDDDGTVDDTTLPPPPLANAITTYSYVADGVFTVDLRVTDIDGNSCWASWQGNTENVTIGESMPEWNETMP